MRSEVTLDLVTSLENDSDYYHVKQKVKLISVPKFAAT